MNAATLYMCMYLGKTLDSNVDILMSDGSMVNAGSQPGMASFNIFQATTMNYQHNTCSSNFGGHVFYKCRLLFQRCFTP
jgi:hypothetical protein